MTDITPRHSPSSARSTLDQLRPASAGPGAKLRALGLVATLGAALGLATAPHAHAICAPVPSALSAWWKMDTVNFGVSTPEIVASNHATIFGNPLTNVLGQVDQSIYLNISPDYLVAQDCQTVDIGAGDFTMMAWVTTPQLTTGTMLSKLELTGGGSVLEGYWFYLSQGNLPAFQARTAGGGVFNYVAFGTPQVNDGFFHLVAVTVDRNSAQGLRLSVDGVESLAPFNPTAWQTQIQTNADLFMGRIDPTINAGGFHMTGNLDEVQIYKRALSLAEIQAIHAAGPDGVCTDRVPRMRSCSSSGGGGMQ
ncbi:MAG: LamG domain-containing protein [Acidobacteriota bacterium]